MKEKPIDNCYWVVPGSFLAGEYPRNLDEPSSIEKLAALKEGGVEVFIDLTEEGDRLPYSQWLDPDTQTHRRFPIRDVSVPSSPELTTAILDTIDDSLAEGKTVYVHCMGGIGRTGTIVGCWLSRHGKSGNEALDRLAVLWEDCPKSAWTRSPETEAQRRYVRDWNDGL
ncbi:MAG: dual specificity protein phosphatase family protein [Chloroflexota bacterium]|nr:dual specificity protein phosphatase family protein [Chloroflexota bacterium]